LIKRLPSILGQFHGRHFNLLYRASRDGHTPTDFHRRCDGRPNTLCIVQPGKNRSIVGGYTPIAWRSADDDDEQCDLSGESFLFVVDPPTRLSIALKSRAVDANATSGPVFAASYADDEAELGFYENKFFFRGKSENEIYLEEEIDATATEIEVFEVTGERPFANLRAGVIDSTIVLELPPLLSMFRDQRMMLLYRGSRDGFEPRDFHRLCNGYAQTIVIVATEEGYVCGGFSKCGWVKGKHEDPGRDSFLFSIRNPHGIEVKLPLKVGKVPITWDKRGGPIFGSSDLVINGTTGKTAGCGSCYENTTAIESQILFTGKTKFEVNEIEVFTIW
jgi:hypothetical protein